MSQVITASRLRDGIVLFVGPSNTWVETIATAEVFPTAEATATALAAAASAQSENLVLDIYAIDVSEEAGVPVPTRLREAIRAQGPTVHPEHGKGARAG